MADGFDPASIPRPGVAQDPGVRMRPSTTLPSRIVDPIGQSVVQLGQEISNIADTFRALHLQRQSADDQVFLDRYQLELNKRYSAIESESANSPDTANPNYVNILDGKLKDTQKNVYDELTSSGQYSVSDEGRRKAEHTAMQMRAASARRSAVAAHNQRVTGYVNIVNDNILEIARTAGTNGDVEGNMARVEASVNTLRGVLAPDKLEELRRTARTQIVESVIKGYEARGQFAEARRLIDRDRGFATNSTEREVATVAGKYGLDPAYLVSVGRIESGSQNRGRHGTATSASGLFGFTEGTGKQYGLPADAGSATVTQQADAAARLTLSNKRFLTNALGRDPTNSELYLAHFLGAGDAAKVLSVAPGTPLAGLVGDASIRANKGVLEGRTAGDLIRWSESRMMSMGGGGADRYLDEAARRRLVSSIETTEHQNQVRADAANTKFLKDYSDSIMREAFSRIDQGNLSTDFVEQARPFVTPTEYKGLLAALRGENNIDDRGAVVDLMEKIDKEDSDAFMQRAINHMNGGRLKTATFKALVNQNRAARRDDAPASPYREGLQYIDSSLDPGALSDSSSAQPLRYGRANARIEFSDWIVRNPEASRDAAIAEARAIVQRYEPIAQEQMTLALGLSRYFDGISRRQLREMRPEARAELLDRATVRVREELEAGRLSKEQANQERRLIQNWRDALNRMLVTTPPAPPRRP